MWKKIRIITCLIVLSSPSFVQGQTLKDIHGKEVGSVYAEFQSVDEAREITDRIVRVVGLKPNFEIRAANIDNAAAVVQNGKRYILYNPVFIRNINKAIKKDWAGISILAHEIGHHLNGHTIMALGSSPAIELEADEFSGFVLRKLGASLKESQAAMSLISSEKGSKTHPGKKDRLAAIGKGWQNGGETVAVKNLPKEQDDVPLVQKQTRSVVEPQLARKYISREVYFHALPGHKFYLTIRNNLVVVKDEGIAVIGKLLKNNKNQIFLNIYDPKNQLNLSVANNGVLYMGKKKVGYMKNI